MEEKLQQAQSLGEDEITALLIRFSLPATLAMAVNASYNIIDTVFVGRLGAEAIAALSVSYPVQMLLGAIGIGTGVGAGSLVSRFLGAAKDEEAAVTVGQVLLLALVFGLASFLACLLYIRPLLVFFGATPEILEMSVQYLSIIAAGAVMLFILMMVNTTVRAEGNAFFSMMVMIASAGAKLSWIQFLFFSSRWASAGRR